MIPRGAAGSAAIGLRAVVAIPARNEVDHLPACLSALAKQRSRTAAASSPLFEVIVFANDCSDGTAERARALEPELPFGLQVVEGRLPAAQPMRGKPGEWR